MAKFAQQLTESSLHFCERVKSCNTKQGHKKVEETNIKYAEDIEDKEYTVETRAIRAPARPKGPKGPPPQTS